MLDSNNNAVIAGDFNEGYGSATQMLKYNDWYDAFSQHHKNTYTWLWKVGPFSIKQKFDRIFFSPHFRIINTQVLHEGESDHYPLIVDFVR